MRVPEHRQILTSSLSASGLWKSSEKPTQSSGWGGKGVWGPWASVWELPSFSLSLREKKQTHSKEMKQMKVAVSTVKSLVGEKKLANIPWSIICFLTMDIST